MLVATNTDGDVQTSCMKYLVLVATTEHLEKCPEVSSKIPSGIMFTKVEPRALTPVSGSTLVTPPPSHQPHDIKSGCENVIVIAVYVPCVVFHVLVRL